MFILMNIFLYYKHIWMIYQLLGKLIPWKLKKGFIYRLIQTIHSLPKTSFIKNVIFIVNVIKVLLYQGRRKRHAYNRKTLYTARKPVWRFTIVVQWKYDGIQWLYDMNTVPTRNPFWLPRLNITATRNDRKRLITAIIRSKNWVSDWLRSFRTRWQMAELLYTPNGKNLNWNGHLWPYVFHRGLRFDMELCFSMYCSVLYIIKIDTQKPIGKRSLILKKLIFFLNFVLVI